MGYLIRLSLANIKVRKLRTVLTIAGIMIGIMSVVTMLTTGIGARKTMLAEVEKAGSSREINVYTTSYGRKDRLLNDSIVKKIEKLDNVSGVYPVIEAQGEEKLGPYIGWNNLNGVPKEYMELLELETGELPKTNGSRPVLLIDKGVRATLYNDRTWQLYKDSPQGSSPIVGRKLDFRLDKNLIDDLSEDEELETASAGDSKEDDEEDESEVKYQKLKVSGETSNQYAYEIYTDIDTMKTYLKRQSVNGRIPGQPLDKNGRPYSAWMYNRLIIRVDDVEKVEHVSKVIQDMGFQAENNLESVKSVTETVNMIRFILGAIGLIAAVVAIIGIINTMMTAVYDRIKEIGLLKMLGSDSDDISLMFLFESAMLGALGGILGVILSLLVNIYINGRLVKYMKMPEGTWIMDTPLWLIIGAVLLSVLVSVLAGAFPARWASKIKPLDAIAG